MLSNAIGQIPARGLQQLVNLLENNAIPEVPEAESEALAAFLRKVIDMNKGS